MVKQIRHVARLVETLPPDIQRVARDAYATGLKKVFMFAAISTLLAYIVRLPVSLSRSAWPVWFLSFIIDTRKGSR